MTASEAAPAPSSSSLVGDVLRLVRVLFSPGKVFAEMQENPPIWVPFIAVAALNVLVSVLMRPFQTRVGQIVAQRVGQPTPEPTFVRTLIGMIIAPIGILVVLAILAGVLYVLSSMLGGTTSYKKMLNVAIYAFPLSVVQQLITWAVLTGRGIQSITGPQDMMVSLGLDNVLLSADSQVGYFTRFVLAGIGPLQIWSLVIVAVGLAVMGKMTRGQAWAAAIVYFVLVLLIISGLGAFGMNMMMKAAGS